MVLQQEEANCSFEGKDYAHGSFVCTDVSCIECVDGKWQDKVELSEKPGLDIGPGEDLSSM